MVGKEEGCSSINQEGYSVLNASWEGLSMAIKKDNHRSGCRSRTMLFVDRWLERTPVAKHRLGRNGDACRQMANASPEGGYHCLLVGRDAGWLIMGWRNGREILAAVMVPHLLTFKETYRDGQ